MKRHLNILVAFFIFVWKPKSIFMRKFLPFVLTLLIVSGCASSEKLLQQGNYAQSITKAIRKLSNNPNDSEQISVLKKAYKLANQQDLDAIKQMSVNEAPQYAPKIYNHYLKLYQRQNQIQRLPDAILRRIGFRYTDYNTLLSQSKENAAQYYHNEGQHLLDNGDLFDARKAYSFFLREKHLFPNDQKINEKIDEALEMGTTHILLRLQNSTGQELPPSFFDVLSGMNPDVLGSHWVSIDFNPVKNRNYQYLLNLNVAMVNLAPEQINRNTYVVKRKIQDGMKYERDNRGNIKRDTLGNPIEIPNYKIIRCTVTKIVLVKHTSVMAYAGIYNNTSGRDVRSENLGSQYTFHYAYGKARGNLKALDKPTRALISRGPVPFPGYQRLLIENARILKDKLEYFLRANRNLFP